MFDSQSKVLAVALACACGWGYGAAAMGAQSDQPAKAGEAREQSAAAVAGPEAAAEVGAGSADDPVKPVSVKIEAPEAAEATEATTASAGEPKAQLTAAEAEAQGVSVGRFDTVSLNVQNTDLAQVLQMLSIQGRRNIVPSPKVSGTVTANLYDVTFQEALDAVLQQNGAGYKKEGNFIFVYTLEELKKIQQAQREVEHRIFRLDYITASDASTFVTPLLSSAGSIALSGEVAAGFQPTIGDGGANSYAHAETMLVRDYPEQLDAIAGVIEKLDIRPKQVLVEATVLSATMTNDLAFGVDVSILADYDLDLFMDPLGPVDDIISGDVAPAALPGDGGGAQTTVGNTNAPGGFKIGVLTDNVAAFVRALDSVTDTTIMANPKIMTLNRQPAEVLVGEKVAYLSTTSTATATTQTVEFLETGTQLTLRPFVSSDGVIRLELKPSISDYTLRESGGQTLPDEITQELTTNVMVRDGETIVLGGLFTEETRITRRQVPFLGNIPILGAAFKGRDDQHVRSEVIFLITPHIIKDQALAAAGEAAMEGVRRAQLGAREGLLPWSRDKLTAAHMRDALRYLEEGNREKALWEVDLALGLDPTMVEARRLKEKLVGYRPYWPERSMLDEAVEVMVQRKTGERPRPDVRIEPDPTPSEMEYEGEGDAEGGVLDAEPGVEAPAGEDRRGAADRPDADAEPASAENGDAADATVSDLVSSYVRKVKETQESAGARPEDADSSDASGTDANDEG